MDRRTHTKSTGAAGAIVLAALALACLTAAFYFLGSLLWGGKDVPETPDVPSSPQAQEQPGQPELPEPPAEPEPGPGPEPEQPEEPDVPYDAVLQLEASARGRSPADVLAELGYALPENASPELTDTVLVEGGFLGTLDTELPTGEGTLRLRLLVSDTVPPRAETADRTGYVGYPLAPEDFVTAVTDETEVSIAFDAEPDREAEGTRQITLLLTDLGGNETRVTVSLTLLRDTKAPVIYTGMDTRYFTVGEAISYYGLVTVTDDVDADVTVTVDKSAVKPREPGTYEVIYTAEDHGGNASSATLTLVFSTPTITKEELMGEIAVWLSEITTEDMTTARKIHAIYDWVYDNVTYTSTSNLKDPLYEAHRALTTHVGDCISSNGLVAYGLEAIGVETLWASRVDGWGPHYWVYANMGTGWYHIDAMHYSGAVNYRVLMATTRELTDYDGGSYWKYDEPNFPAPATEEFHDPDDPDDTENWAAARKTWT